MRTGSEGLALIKVSEGYGKRLPNGSCQAYLDTLVSPSKRSPGYKGLWTIGYGCTVGVTAGMVWTERQATRALQREIAKHEAALNAKMRQYKVALDQNQYDALISASYNLGTASTLITSVLQLLANGNEAAAANQFLKYNRAGGVTRGGLVTRRRKERALFLEHTTGTLTRASRKLTWLQRIRAAIASSGVVGYFTWDNFAQVQTYITDHIALILIGTGISVWVILKIFDALIRQDHKQGRYTPSKD